MPAQAGTLELLARELAEALRPLERRLAQGNVEAFVAELGLRLPPGVAGVAQLVSAVATTASAAAGLPPLIGQLTTAIQADNGPQILSAGQQLLSRIGQVLNGLTAIRPAVEGAAAAAAG